MNKYKPYLDSLYEKLESYRFISKKVDSLFENDASQLREGGDYLDISHMYIRDWSNFSDTNWQIDYRRTHFVGKEEYLQEIDRMKSAVFKHYIIEAYERLVEFIGSVLDIEKRSLRFDKLMKKLDVNLHNSKTPFGFNLITFLVSFCKARNAFTHNAGIVDPIREFNQDYLKEFDFNQQKGEWFFAAYFESTPAHEGYICLNLRKHSFVTLIGFAQSYAFELYRNRCEKEGIGWAIENEPVRKDIKTNLPLNETQLSYVKELIEKMSQKGSSLN